MKTHISLSKAEKKKNRMRVIHDMMNDRQLYLMLLPFLVYYIIFFYMPMYGLQIAFKDYKPFVGIWGSKWVGLEHFKTFFSGPFAWRVIRNTITINLYALLQNFTLTIVMALLINEIRHSKLKSFVQTIMYMPHFISTVVVAGLVITMLSPTSGIINVLIKAMGGESIYFLTEPKYFKTIYVLMGLWQQLGFNTIIYTSAICSIDESLYEAAEIDGAGRLRKILHITIPGILGTIVTMLIMRMGSLLTVGSEAILLLYQPITYETADVISTFVYRSGIEEGNYSFSTAVGLFNSLISLVLVVSANKISKKLTEVSLW